MRLIVKGLQWIATACLYTPALAIAITVVEPNGTGEEKIAEGVEFSTYVIGNRWDMSDSADVITSESGNLSNEIFSNGIYQATSVDDAPVDGITDAKFFLTFPGLPSAIFSNESGQKNPIDTSVFSKLTIKIRHLNANGTPSNTKHPVQVFFFKDENSIRDGTFGKTQSVKVDSDGDWHIVTIDLVDGVALNSPHTWNDFNTIKGLRIDPTQSPNTRIEVDWVRLTTAGDASSEFFVEWTGGSAPFSVAARKQNNVPVTLATDIIGNSANIDFSVLPPGEYIIEVSDALTISGTTPVRPEGGSDSTGDSAATLHINEAPMIDFLQPDIRGDEENNYALIEAGNPWGPMDTADVASTKHLTAISYSNPVGSFIARSTGSDSHLYLNTPRAIDTQKYRMLSFTMSLSGERDIGTGSIARVFWGNEQSNLLNTSEDIIVQEGLNTYEIGDMRNLRIEGGPANQWQGAPVYFRIDPHEFPTVKNIRIDDITLAPLDTADPSFDITWLDFDPDDDAVIELFVDEDQFPDNGNEVRIANGISENNAANSFNWNAPDNVVDGEYFVYARIDDGFNRITRYATGPVAVGSGAAINVTVTAPDGIDDDVVAANEFSREIEGNAWNMSDSGDVPFARSRNISSQSISGGYLSGTSTGNDPVFYLLYPGSTDGHTGSNGLLTPISTSDFRYLTFKARYSGPGPHFFRAYFMKDTTFSAQSVGFTEGVQIFPGDWQVITVDLHTMSSGDSPFAWQDVSLIKGLRIDPANVAGSSWEFDWFTLTGEPVAGSQYQVRWNASNPGDSTLNINAVDTSGFRIPLLSGVPPQVSATSVDLTHLPMGDYIIEVDAVPGGADLSNGPISIVQDVLVSDSELRNISTRADVRTGNEIAIGGFVIAGNTQKCVVVQGLGSSVGVDSGVERLADPVLTLKSGLSTIAQNDNWQIQDKPGDVQILQGLGRAPGDILEAAIYKCLDPGSYTALLTGYLNSTGVGIVAVFDADDGAPYLKNIATRSWVGTGAKISIAGFVITGSSAKQILVRGLGPSMQSKFPPGAQLLTDPFLKLYRGSTLIASNDDWGDAVNSAEIGALSAGVRPTDARESAILVTLEPGLYSAHLSGVGAATGIGNVAVYDLTGRD